MNARANYLAFDLGAESGRAVLGRFDGQRVTLEEVHRFANTPVKLSDGLHWDVLRIFAEIKEGLAKAAGLVDDAGLHGIGVDTWAVDFGLLDRDGALVGNPYHHRDGRTEGMLEEAFRRLPREEMYRTTGIQFLRINTVYQLLAMENSPLLGVGETLLMIPDLLNYWLTGEKACEYTNATSTQLYDLERDGWATEMMGHLGIPDRLFPKIVPPATELGPLLLEVAREAGIEGADVPVIAVASHDTASAVVAVPAEVESFAYVSSGTWSLVGVETPRAVTTSEAMSANFTNEGGVGGRKRLLKNVMGLWLLQECRREWASNGEEYTYEELVRLAEEAPAFGALVDPDHPSFMAPGDMLGRIRSFCEETGQKPPQGPGETSRCILDSLALKYRHVIEQAERLSERPVEAIHVVGGGSRNVLLCQLTADATRLPVLAGPVEATAMGNVMVQALARGQVGSLGEIRAVVRSSVEVGRHEPRGDAGRWNDVAERFSRLVDTAAVPSGPEGG
ncbi:MAG TPA: rhamnulokinase family protein [Rubrobacter sp.]|jgi:rhamnulokinase|nr:rhamnulokinase family protein [Rubrobacter sp.]